MDLSRHLVHTAAWERRTGETTRGDAEYADPVEIPCRIERRSGHERGQGDQSYTRIMVEPVDGVLVTTGDKMLGEVIEDYSDQVDGSGEVVGRIVYARGRGTFQVTVHRPRTEPDEYGNPRQLSDAQGQPVYDDHEEACYWIGPARSEEYTQGRQTMTTFAVANFPSDADIQGTDEVTAGGLRYRVTGLVRQPRPTLAQEWQTTVNLERAE